MHILIYFHSRGADFIYNPKREFYEGLIFGGGRGLLLLVIKKKRTRRYTDRYTTVVKWNIRKYCDVQTLARASRRKYTTIASHYDKIVVIRGIGRPVNYSRRDLLQLRWHTACWLFFSLQPNATPYPMYLSPTTRPLAFSLNFPPRSFNGTLRPRKAMTREHHCGDGRQSLYCIPRRSSQRLDTVANKSTVLSRDPGRREEFSQVDDEDWCALVAYLNRLTDRLFPTLFPTLFMHTQSLSYADIMDIFMIESRRNQIFTAQWILSETFDQIFKIFWRDILLVWLLSATLID